jgi:hypothetical protein
MKQATLIERGRLGVAGGLVLVLASLFSTIPSAPVVAQAGEVPNLEFAAGCRNTAAGNAATLDSCMRDEQGARQKLTTEWDGFPHADRTQCTALAKMGTALQSYVELITCLEMAKQARDLPKEAKE